MPGFEPFFVTISTVRTVLNLGEAENSNAFAQLNRYCGSCLGKPGERILLLASPGFVFGKQTQQASAIVDRANRANIVINTLDARGLTAPEVGGDISLPGSDPASTVGLKMNFRLAEQSEGQFSLMDFAHGTGGTFFHNSNNLEGGLKQLGSVPEVSYVLGFSPQGQKMDGHFHAIKVTLTAKQKYVVQARRGYYAPKKPDDPPRGRQAEIQEAVFSRDEIQDIPLSLQTQYFKTEGTGTQLSVVSHVDLKGLRFRKADGRNFDDVTVATVIFDKNGSFVAGGEKLVKLRLLDIRWKDSAAADLS